MMRRHVRPSLLRLPLALFVAAACSDATGNDVIEPTLELTANPAAPAAGQDVVFRYEARGNLLDVLTLEYGDGAVSEVILGASQRAEGQIRHAFAEPGSYTVVGSLLDGVVGPLSAEVVVTVSEAAAVAGR
jgi:hypothetical protein